MKTMIQAAAVTLIAASAAHAQQAVQWKVSDGGNGHWYQRKSIPGGGSFGAIRALATSIGGDLTSVHSAAQDQFVREVASPFSVHHGALIGTRTPSDCMSFAWSDGSPWDYAAWAAGQPNCKVGDGIGYYPDGWHDLYDFHVASYVVEWSADCNNDGIVDYGQILEGHLADANSNNVPDRCECGAFPTLPSCCLGDLNADRSVDGADLGALLFAWGPAVPQSPADLDGDGQVGGADLGLLLFGWGACPVATPPWATLLEALPDPAVVTDPSLRAAIAATGLAWRVRDIGTGIEMLLVPPGTFQMGCSPSIQSSCFLDEEAPVHLVALTKPFYLGRFELTQAQWVARMGSNPSRYQGYADSPSRPVEQVSWNSAQAYLGALDLRLPTEAEWEYACRAGTASAFNNGSDDELSVGAIAWFGSNSGNQTRSVGQKSGNRLGFHDMHGNAYEWVNDWYSSTYYSAGPLVNPPGPETGETRVCRGGALNDPPGRLRSSIRYYGLSSDTGAGYPLGLRVARDP